MSQSDQIVSDPHDYALKGLFNLQELAGQSTHIPAYLSNIAFHRSSSESLASSPMAFFGNLVSADRAGKKEQPIKLPPLDKTQVLKRFERTLVGRVLLREAQEQNHKALISFLPTVWRCKGRVHGQEMGEGRIHFRFQNEEDLEEVMAHRSYHFDGSMIALERWIPTVRRDNPNTIPFWIVIKGLPDYRIDEESVRSIGEALGEWLDVDVSELTPRVKVVLDSNAPLVLRRESDDDGVLIRLTFKYEKLQKHCHRCLRITHESQSCPERAQDAQPHHREQRRDTNRRKESEAERGRQRNPKADRGKAVVSQPERATSSRKVELVSRPKPVRQDILAELDSCQINDAVPGTAQSSTKE